MEAWQLILWVLAVNQAGEIWHHGQIAARLRAEVEVGTGFIARLAGCPWCLSVWLALAVAGMGLLAANLIEPWSSLLQWPVWALGVSRGANLVNDLTYAYSRTPRDTGS
jgi:hypothetical protein